MAKTVNPINGNSCRQAMLDAGYKIRKDWKVIKNKYILTPITAEELCKKYSIPSSTIERRMSKEKWVEARKKHNGRLEEKTLNLDIESKIDERQALIKSIENVVRLKLNAEARVGLKLQSVENLKFLASILNKSKNNIAELTKIAELLKGNATERTEVSEKEKQERIDRLNRYRTASTNTILSTN